MREGARERLVHEGQPHQVLVAAVQPRVFKLQQERSPVPIAIQCLRNELDLVSRAQFTQSGVAPGGAGEAEQH